MLSNKSSVCWLLVCDFNCSPSLLTPYEFYDLGGGILFDNPIIQISSLQFGFRACTGLLILASYHSRVLLEV